ncbi:MAG TPA: TetR/AcrR family transcriptional regulator [Desulfobacterales bacterium]|nr:TetR/AcrR family transcriptional regulator [Desulfobacterales bacterium]
MCPKIVNKQAKKQDILEAAMRVFAKKGVANAKMADVADAAGIGKGTIYEYFKSKEDIFAEAFHHFMEQMDAVMAKRLFKLHDPIEKLMALIAGWVEVTQDTSTGFLEIMMDFWAEGVRHKQEPAAFDLRKLYDEYRRWVVKILEEGISKGKLRPVNTTIVASILIGALDGLMLQWIMDHNLFKLDEVADVLTESFIEGLRKDA